MCSRSIPAPGRRAIIHAKGPCLDEGKEGRASAQNHSLGRCLAFPPVSVMLRYSCGVSNEGVRVREVLSPQRAHGRTPTRPAAGPREARALAPGENRLVFLFLWLLVKRAHDGPRVTQSGAYLAAPLLLAYFLGKAP